MISEVSTNSVCIDKYMFCLYEPRGYLNVKTNSRKAENVKATQTMLQTESSVFCLDVKRGVANNLLVKVLRIFQLSLLRIYFLLVLIRPWCVSRIVVAQCTWQKQAKWSRSLRTQSDKTNLII